MSLLVLRAVIWLFSRSRPPHRPLLRWRPPSRPDSSVSFNCLGKSLRTPPAVTMATLCAGLFFFASLLSDARTFAERAVWSAEVHQAGYLRRVAHVCHHRLLSVMDRWICRGWEGGEINNLTPSRIIFTGMGLLWYVGTIQSLGMFTRTVTVTAWLWLQLELNPCLSIQTQNGNRFIDQSMSHPATVGGNMAPSSLIIVDISLLALVLQTIRSTNMLAGGNYCSSMSGLQCD